MSCTFQHTSVTGGACCSVTSPAVDRARKGPGPSVEGHSGVLGLCKGVGSDARGHSSNCFEACESGTSRDGTGVGEPERVGT